MNLEREAYNDFFTFNDVNEQKKLIHLVPFPSTQNVTPELLTTNDENGQSTYVIRKGELWADLLSTGWPGKYVVSEQVRDVLIEATGVTFHPINILDTKLQDVNVNYYRIQILGKSGPLMKELSREEVATRIVGGPEYIKKIGLYFIPGSWDGSDFFTPENTLNIFITSKIKALLEKHKFTNILMEPIVNVETF
jgi:hypothetical protein